MKATTSQITFGKEISKVKAGDFVLTETFHSPSLILPRHDHEHANVNFTITGTFRETIGRRPQECGASSLLIKPAGEVHANEYGRRGAHCLIIEVPHRRLESFRPLSDLFEKPDHIENTFLARIAMSVYRELHASGGPSLLLIEGLVLELLALAARVEPCRRNSSPRWLDDVRRLLHERFTSPLSLSTLAQHFGIHPSYLARSFRERHGCSVGTYINSLRIEYAMQELHHFETPLSVIAANAGFYDQSQFTNVFKRQLGITPYRYRTAVRSGDRIPNKHRLSKT
jgi:AraC family transcriptional regulator